MTAWQCACGFDGGWPKFTADWHRRHRDAHVAAFPELDQCSRDNLAVFIDMAARREAAA